MQLSLHAACLAFSAIESCGETTRAASIAPSITKKASGPRGAMLDACEVLGIAPTVEQRAQLGAMGGYELEALWAAFKQTRRWPA